MLSMDVDGRKSQKEEFSAGYKAGPRGWGTGEKGVEGREVSLSQGSEVLCLPAP